MTGVPRGALRVGYGPGAVAVVAGAVGIAALMTWELAVPRLAVRFEPASLSVLGERAAMAAWGAAGLAATALFLARTEGLRTALYAAAVLATMPAWFVHGRTATGVMVPMAACAMVLAGLVVAVLDARASRAMRLFGGAIALAGAMAGAASRGALVVAAPAAIAVGFVAVASNRTSGARVSRRGALVLALGLCLLAAGAVFTAWRMDTALARAIAGPLAAASRSDAVPRFDLAAVTAVYTLVPWSPLLPLALARRPATDVHLATALTAALGLAAHAWLAPRNGAAMLVALAPLAASIALSLRGLDTVEIPSAAVVATVVVVGLLVVRDIEASPERVLDAIGSADDPIGAGARSAGALPSAAATTAKVARVATAAATALAAAILLAPRAWLPAGRGLLTAAVGMLAGLALRGYAYPSLLARLSPGAAWQTWARVHAEGESLGTLRVDPRAMPKAAAASLSSAEAAAQWLGEPPSGTRRYVALASGELARLNASFRASHHANVPILAGGDGTVMLAASVLAAGERSESPLDAVVFTEPPAGLRPIGAVAGDHLELLGWDLRDARGASIETARPGRSMHVRLALRVRPDSTESLGAYCTFLHIDHTPTRFSAEHREHAYPMGLWRAGDVIVDDFEVTLPAHFRAGKYALWWGIGALPCADDRRMPVTSGPSDGHGRMPGGTLELR